MADQNSPGHSNGPGNPVFNEMIKVGLADPFIRAIVGVVAVATAAAFAVSVIGDGTRAVIAVGLSLMFGVVLVVLRVLMKNLDSPIVRWLCLFASGVIIAVFLALIVLAVPAITVCWPAMYRETMGLQPCGGVPQARAFAPTPYVAPDIKYDPANRATQVLVFYRAARQRDAERLVGALRSAGYASDGVESDLNEVVADNRSPGVSLIKTTGAARSITPEILRISQLVMPDRAPLIGIYPVDTALKRGAIQVDLF
jgi:hypothetical protein